MKHFWVVISSQDGGASLFECDALNRSDAINQANAVYTSQLDHPAWVFDTAPVIKDVVADDVFNHQPLVPAPALAAAYKPAHGGYPGDVR